MGRPRSPLPGEGDRDGAKGTTSGLVATLTAAGVSARNARYSALIARREQRRDAEQAEAEEQTKPNPIDEARKGLTPERRRRLVEHLDLRITLHRYQRDAGDAGELKPATPSTPEAEAQGAAWIASFGTATDDNLDARDEAVLAQVRPPTSSQASVRRSGLSDGGRSCSPSKHLMVIGAAIPPTPSGTAC